MSVTLTPAYGRDYKSKREVEDAFWRNNDFIMNDITSPWDGKPCSLSDLQGAGYTSVQLRFDQERKVHVVEIDNARPDQ